MLKRQRPICFERSGVANFHFPLVFHRNSVFNTRLLVSAKKIYLKLRTPLEVKFLHGDTRAGESAKMPVVSPCQFNLLVSYVNS